jgi:hypothetical protein
MAEQALTRHDLEAKIVKRSWEDEAFRKEFTSDPTGTAVKYLKVTAAELPKIVVHEEAAGTWHIVLPAKPAGTDELSEGELEKVAGGVMDPVVITIVPKPTAVGISTGSVPASQTPPIWYPPQEGW